MNLSLQARPDPPGQRGGEAGGDQEAPGRRGDHRRLARAGFAAAADHRPDQIVALDDQVEEDGGDVQADEADQDPEKLLVPLGEDARGLEIDQVRQRPRLDPVLVAGEQAEADDGGEQEQEERAR